MSCDGDENVNRHDNDQSCQIDERTVTILKDIFGSVTEEIIIREVVSSCRGNLTSSIECLMKITNSNELHLNGDRVCLGQNDDGNPQHGDSRGVASGSNFELSHGNTRISYSSAIGMNENRDYVQQNISVDTSLNLNSKNMTIQNIINDINEGYRVLVLMRGLPGSGKTTLARKIIDSSVKENFAQHIFSTDDFFNIRNNYVYNVNRLTEAHEWNQNRVTKALRKGFSPIIVDNTNLEIWTMQPYACIAVENGYIIHVLEPQTPWAHKPRLLAQKNIHNVPVDRIRKMSEKFQKDLSSDYLIKLFKLKYPSTMMPPVLRTFPKNMPKEVKVKPAQFTNSPISHVDGIQQCYIPQNVKNTPYAGTNSNCDFYWGTGSDFSHHEIPQNQQNSLKSWEDRVDQPNRSQFPGEFSQMQQDFQNLPKYSGSPKPQRSISAQRKTTKLDKSGLFSTDSVNWEPISSSMSEWICVENPAANSSSHMDEWTDISNVEMADASTNTLSFDINPENQSYFTILTSVSREINSALLFTPAKSPGLKVALDKGTMTCDEEEFSTAETHEENKIEYLKNMQAVFNDIPEDYLQDILERCNGDLNWAVEILLDGKTEFRPIPKVESKQAPEDSARGQTEPSVLQPEDHLPVLHLPSSTQNDIYQDDSNVENIENACQKEKSFSETAVNLKKHIEDNFVISDDHYSEHVSKLRRRIRGEKSPPRVSQGNEGQESAPATPEPIAGPSNRSLSESSEDIEEEDSIVSVTVGKEFIDKLHEIYGSYTCDSNLEPIIHMPISLLNQIHALWMESLYNQIDVQKEYLKSIIKEDEEFARHLEAKEVEEQKKGEVHEVPNLREIMDMEVALAQYKISISEWKKETPDDIASRLTRQKLFQLFPEVNPEILLEVLNAHNNSFEQTCQVLLVSTGKIAMTQGEDEGQKAIQQILIEQEKDLLARANLERQKVMCSENSVNTTDNVNGDTVIKNYRDEAVQHLNIRSKYYNKAKEYYNRGMTHAATYYSQLAALHTRKHDYINSLAASEIMEANTSQSDHYTLDLHCLYVVEACQVLDMFLDKHIRLLRDKKKKKQSVKLFLITGRGLHSPGKQARIKPAVKARLQQRNLRFYEVNAGLLGVDVCSENLLTDIVTEINN